MDRRQYDRVGPDYIAAQHDYFADRPDRSREYFASVLPDLTGVDLLDVGCGAGEDLQQYQRHGANVRGIDVSPAMIDYARGVVGDRVEVAPAERLPFPDSCFDVVTARFSLHYLQDMNLAYREAARVLREHGTLAVIGSHPIVDLIHQQNPVYGEQEVKEVDLYGGDVRVKFPTHTLSDYFSPEFFQHFHLTHFTELDSRTDGKTGLTVPSVIGFAAVKSAT